MSDMPSIRNVLIVEDEPQLSQLFSKVLRKAGYQVHEAASLQTARELLQSHIFDLMLCDIEMGSERGTDLLKEKWRFLDGRGTQVIAMSAENKYRNRCEEIGADFFMEKPISPAMLVSMVNRLTQTVNTQQN